MMRKRGKKRAASDFSAALTYALRILSRRMYTVREMEAKLKGQGCPDEVAQEVLAYLQEKGYLDDRFYARLWVERRLDLKPMGRRRLAWELKQKGVPEEVVAKALAEVTAEEEEERALRLVARRFSLPEEREKAGAFLWRRGFSPEVINRVLRRLTEEKGDNSPS